MKLNAMIAEAKALVLSQNIVEVKETSQSTAGAPAGTQPKAIPHHSMLVLRNYEEVERLQKTLKLDLTPPPEGHSKTNAYVPQNFKQRANSIKPKDKGRNQHLGGQGQILCPVFPGDRQSSKEKPRKVEREA